MLQHMFRLKYRDAGLCKLAAEALERKEFTNLNQMASVLYMLAKNRYPAGQYVDSAI